MILKSKVKENSLYRQNYCGCLFGLSAQREAQKKIMDEMFNPISKQILPESIEQRLELYKKRNTLENEKKEYKVADIDTVIPNAVFMTIRGITGNEKNLVINSLKVW